MSLSTDCSISFPLLDLYYLMNLSVVVVKQHCVIDVGVILIHVRLIVFWNYLRLAVEVVLLYIKERSVVVRVILIVFIIGFVAKFLLNG